MQKEMRRVHVLHLTFMQNTHLNRFDKIFVMLIRNSSATVHDAKTYLKKGLIGGTMTHDERNVKNNTLKCCDLKECLIFILVCLNYY